MVHTLIQQINETEDFLSIAVALVDRINGAKADEVSTSLFQTTYNDLSRVTRLAFCSHLETADKIKQKKYLDKATALCEQTFRTLLATHIKFCVDQCEIFRQYYSVVAISDIVHDYQASNRKVKDIEASLESLGNKGISTEHLDHFKQAFKEISTILGNWDGDRSILDQKVAEKEENERETVERAKRAEAEAKKKKSIFWWINAIVGLLVGIATIVGVVWQIIKSP